MCNISIGDGDFSESTLVLTYKLLSIFGKVGPVSLLGVGVGFVSSSSYIAFNLAFSDTNPSLFPYLLTIVSAIA